MIKYAKPGQVLMCNFSLGAGSIIKPNILCIFYDLLVRRKLPRKNKFGGATHDNLLVIIHG